MHFIISISVWLLHAKPANRAWPGTLLKLLADVHETGPITREHPLVPSRTQCVDLHPFYIDLESTGGLTGIHNQRVFAFSFTEFFEIGSEPIRILHVTHCDDPRAHVHCRLDAIGTD